eukprot:2531990-Rhodomonas_salina.1
MRGAADRCAGAGRGQISRRSLDRFQTGQAPDLTHVRPLYQPEQYCPDLDHLGRQQAANQYARTGHRVARA